MRDERESMAGRVCVVTGASSGIGLETARGLAARGAHTILLGRSPERTRAARDAIAQETGAPVEHHLVDFSSLRDVRRAATAIRAAHERVHVLVNNAGLVHLDRRHESADGYEDTFAVNHLAPFLFTRELLPSLLADPPARAVTVSSRLHLRVKRFEWDDWGYTRRRYRGMGAYQLSKLANVMFANELARRLEGRGVTSNSLHPGDVATNVVRDNRLLQWGLDHVARFFMKTAAEGARASLRLATDPELEDVTGRYFDDEGAPMTPSPIALDLEACARLWRLSEELVDAALDGAPRQD